MKVIPTLVLSAFAVLLAFGVQGCTPTSYHATSMGTGYSDRKLDKNRYEISYTANAMTSRQKVKHYLLYRAAEITLDTGNKKFVVLEQHPGRGRLEGVKYGEEGKHYEFEHHHLWFNDPNVSQEYSTTRYQPLSQYTATATFQSFSGAEPPVDGKVFDSRELIELLGPSVFQKN